MLIIFGAVTKMKRKRALVQSNEKWTDELAYCKWIISPDLVTLFFISLYLVCFVLTKNQNK